MTGNSNSTGDLPDKSTRKAKKRSRPRSAMSYIKSAKANKKLAPSLAKYTTKEYIRAAKAGRLSASAKAAIARKEKLLRHTENLRPLNKREYKKAKKLGITAGKGLHAIRLRNTEEKTKIKITKKGLQVGSNGHTITYVIVEPPELENIIDAAAEAFSAEYFENEDYDGEEDDASDEFYTTEGAANVTVWLWTIAGRASRGFRSLKLFIEDISKAFSSYTNQAEWIRGIAWLKETSAAPRANRGTKKNRRRR